jgi:hypothetical protein
VSPSRNRKSLPLFDDWGNLLQQAPAERTFERKQGCWNCKNFDAGDLFAKRVEECFRRDVKAFLNAGIGLDQSGLKADVTRKTLLGFVPPPQPIPGEKPRPWIDPGPIRRGLFGICLKGKVESDFVACKHLCLDGWDGRLGVTGSFSPGEKYDEPVAALFDEHGEKPGGEPKDEN